jgi:hypothetical protein
MAFPFLPWLEHGRSVLRLRDLPAITLAVVALLLVILPPVTIFAVRVFLCIFILGLAIWAVIVSHQKESKETADKADLHSRHDKHDLSAAEQTGLLADIKATLDAKLPTDASHIAIEFYTLSREIEQFESAEEREFWRFSEIVRQFKEAPIPDQEKLAAEEEYKAMVVAALVRFSTEYEPKIRDLLKRSREAGYPDELGEGIWNSITTYNEPDKWPVVFSSRHLLDKIAGRIVKRAAIK